MKSKRKAARKHALWTSIVSVVASLALVVGLLPIQGMAWAGNGILGGSLFQVIAQNNSSAPAQQNKLQAGVGDIAVEPFKYEANTVKRAGGALLAAGNANEVDSMTYELRIYDMEGNLISGMPDDMKQMNPHVFAYLEDNDTGLIKGWNCTPFDQATGKATVPTGFSDNLYSNQWNVNTNVTYDPSKHTLRTRVVQGYQNGGLIQVDYSSGSAQWIGVNWSGKDQFDGYKFLPSSNPNPEPNVFKMQKDWNKKFVVDLSYAGSNTNESAQATIIVRGQGLTTGWHYYKLPPSNVNWNEGVGTYAIPEWFRKDGSSFGNDYSDAWQNVEAVLFAGDITVQQAAQQLEEQGKHGIPYLAGYFIKNGERVNGDIDYQTATQEVILPVVFDSTPLDDALTPEEVLGDAYEFGIVADTYKQSGHTETNFAVKHYDHNANLDIEGTAATEDPIPFYIGEIKNILTFGLGHHADAYVYTPQSEIDKNVITQASSNHEVAKIPTSVDEVNAYVDSMISDVMRTSVAMSQKTTLKPAKVSNGKAVIDTRDYPDNTTIYVDCGNIIDKIAAGGDLQIHKKDGQTIVLNVLSSGHVDIGEFHVWTDKYGHEEGDKIASTTVAKNRDDEKNLKVDEVIFSHVFFNMPNASSVHTNNASAMFLAPAATMFTQSNGAGWIVCGGTVDSASEWHFYRHARHFDSTIAQLQVAKAFGADAPEAASDKEYLFYVRNRVEGNDVYYFTKTEATVDGDKVSTSSSSTPTPISVRGAGKVTLATLVPGEYEIVELRDGAAISGYTLNVTGEGTKTIAGGRTTYATVTNTYTPSGSIPDEHTGSATVSVTKRITGDKLHIPATFTFKLEKAEKEGRSNTDSLGTDAQGNELTALEATVTNQGDSEIAGTAEFSEITYTEAGEYYYTITESDPTTRIPGMTYDSDPEFVWVHVDQNADTKALSASVKYSADGGKTYSNDATSAVVTNTYERVGDHLYATKYVKRNGGSETTALGEDADKFTFSIVRASMSEGGEVDEALNNPASPNAEGKIDFGTMQFMRPGTYKYTVQEGNVTAPGWEEDSSTYTVTYVVDENLNFTKTVTNAEGGSDVGEAGFKFVNTYTASATDAVPLVGNKTLVNSAGEKLALEGDEFTFNVAPSANPQNPVGADESQFIASAKNDKDGKIDFGSLSFSKEGTWHYTVSEVPAGDDSGILSDPRKYDVQIVVKDNGEGKLIATVTDYLIVSETQESPVSTLDFENTQLSGVAQLKVNKEMTGDTNASTYTDSYRDKAYTFQLAKDDETSADALPTVDTAQAKSGNTAVFGEITYSKPGTYYYVIRELDDEMPDVTYDLKPRFAKVVVTKDANEKKLKTSVEYSSDEGSQVADKVYSPDVPTVSNKYTKLAPDIEKVNLEATKTIDGMTPNDSPSKTKEFNFIVTPAQSNPTEGATEKLTSPATSDAEGVIDFGSIEFAKPGDWTYVIQETGEDTAGITIDRTVYTVAYHVVEDATANTLKATPTITKISATGETASNPKGVVFDNKYRAQPVSVTFTGTKTLVGGTLKGNDFSFELDGVTDNTATTSPNSKNGLSARNDAEGQIVLTSDDKVAEVQFNAPGVYEYIAKETSKDGIRDGVSIDCDETEHRVAVTVTDNGKGQLEATVTVDDEPVKGANVTTLDFSNTVLAGTVTLGVSKTVRGNTDRSDYAAEEEFSFVLAKATGSTHASDVLPEMYQVTTKAGKSANFGAISFKEPGVYYYSISEKPGNTVGMSYAAPQFAKIVVDKNMVEGEPTLKATSITYASTLAELDDETTDAATQGIIPMVNTYTKTNFTPNVTKVYKSDNNTTAPADTFTFLLANRTNAIDNNGQSIANGGTTATLEMQGAGKATAEFGELTFTKPGTYKYEITERPGATHGTHYSIGDVFVTVEVSADDATGALTATVAEISGGDTDAHELVNTHDHAADSVAVTVSGLKKLNGGEPGHGSHFDFSITPVAGNPETGADEEGLRTTDHHNHDDGAIDFGRIVFNEPGEWSYIVRETSEDGNGVTVDDAVYTITYTVVWDNMGTEDLGDDQLKATSSIMKGEGEQTESVDSIEFNNTYTATAASVDLSGLKTLTGGTIGNGQFSFELVNKDGKVLQTKQNGADGKFAFDTLSFDAEGVYTYTVREKNADVPEDILVDTASYSVVVKVEDDKKGALVPVATATKEPSHAPVAVDALNFMNVKLHGAAKLQVTKGFEGQYAGDEAFAFNLEKESGPDGDALPKTTVATAKSGKAAVFDEITFIKEGEYFYKITEVKGDTSGITYNTEPGYAKVKVQRATKTDPSAHTLTADVKYGSRPTREDCNDTSLLITNKAAAPAIEKYVNKDVHANLSAFDTPFTYDILAYVTADADKVEIVDQLVSGIRFAGGAADVKVADMGTSVDHKAKGTVEQDGAALDGAQVMVNVETKTLTVTIGDASALRGHWVKVAYPAKLDNSVVGDWAQYNDNARNVDDNGPVQSDIDHHKGVENTASYKVFVKRSDGDMPVEPTYSEESNTVTVTPGTTSVKVEKVWKDAQGETLEWPLGATVTIELLKNGQSTDPKTFTVLTASKASDTFANLPKYLMTSYSVKETAITGVPDGYVDVVTRKADDDFIITNNKTRVRISKVDIANGAELPGATMQILLGETVVEEWTSIADVESTVDVNEAIHEVDGLKVGTAYTLRETVAPNGYAIASDTTFALNADGTVDAGKTTTTVKDGVLLVQDKLCEPAAAIVSVTKEVTTNVPWATEEEFEFTLAGAGNTAGIATPMPATTIVKAKAGKTVDFGEIAYTKEGEYYYTITETAGTTENLSYDTEPKWVKVKVEANADRSKLNSTITYGKGQDTCTDSKLTVSNVYAVPALEKYINKDVHQDLPAFDTPFTYDILAFVTKDADKVVIRDGLIEGVSFNCKSEDVRVEDIGPVNDHTAHSTVEKATKFKDENGKEVEVNSEVELNGKNLTVTIPDATAHRGHWVRVTYSVRLDNSVVSNSSEYVDNDKSVAENGTVISNAYPNGTEESPSHDGVETNASYEVFVYKKVIDEYGNVALDENGKPKFETDSNGSPVLERTYPLVANYITVTPPTVTIPVSKTWANFDGKGIEWPKGTTVSVELLGVVNDEAMPLDQATTKVLGADKAMKEQVITLTADKTSGAFEELPVYEAIEYTVVESSVTGAPEGFTTTIAGSVDEGFTVTNTYKEPKQSSTTSSSTTTSSSSTTTTSSSSSTTTSSSSSTTTSSSSSTTTSSSSSTTTSSSSSTTTSSSSSTTTSSSSSTTTSSSSTTTTSSSSTTKTSSSGSKKTSSSKSTSRSSSSSSSSRSTVAGRSQSSTPKTGDSLPVMPFVAVLGVSAIGILLALLRRIRS